MRAIAVIVASFALLGCAPEPAQQTTQGWIAGPAWVVDGNTIEIQGQRVRVFGYDTPQSGAYCGDTNVYELASLALLDFVAHKTVSCTSHEMDANAPLTATCSVGEIDLGAHMVNQGWGRDRPGSKAFSYANEEEVARSQQRGIWALQCPADVWGDTDQTR